MSEAPPPYRPPAPPAAVQPPTPPVAPPAPSQRELARRSLSLPQDALEAECELEFFIASGPGGQHRNKTESGVRLTHRPTGIVVTATERRSQHQNRGHALERLREKLQALTVVQKPRKKTKPSKASKRRRVESKRRLGEKKANRRRLD